MSAVVDAQVARMVLPSDTQRFSTRAQQRADALVGLITEPGEVPNVSTEVVVHVSAKCNSLDDGTPLSDHAVTRLLPDSFVSLLQTNLGHAGAHRVPTRIDIVDGHDVCRVDVPASSRPIWATFKGADRVLFERRNNSTRRVPEEDIDAFLAERFGSNRTDAREPRGLSPNPN